MNVIFIIGALQALFFSILIFNKKKKDVSDKILAVWMLVFFVQLAVPFIAYSKIHIYNFYFSGVDIPLLALHAAFLFVYAKALVNRNNKFECKWLLHLLPTIAVFISILPYFLSTAEEKAAFYDNSVAVYDFRYISSVLVSSVLIGLSFGVYLFLTLKLLNKHRQEIKKEYSYEKDVDLKWLRNLAIAITVFVALLLWGIIIIELKIISLFQGDCIMYSLFVLLIYTIGFCGFKQGHVFVYHPYKEEPKKEKVTPIESQDIILTSRNDRMFIRHLKIYMEVEKPYLNNKQNLHDLAKSLEVTSTYLSKILNNCLEINFYQFINKYRVEEVQRRIRENKQLQMPLLTIALECGFNSKATFNRIFKDVTGLTPSEYQKSVNGEA